MSRTSGLLQPVFKAHRQNDGVYTPIVDQLIHNAAGMQPISETDAAATRQLEQAVRVATQYATPLSSPVGAQAPRAPPSRRNVAVLSHAEYVPTLTAAAALRVKVALSKAAW